MNGSRFVLCFVIVSLLCLDLEALPRKGAGKVKNEESKRNRSEPAVVNKDSPTTSASWIAPINGLKVNYTNKELIVRYSPDNEDGVDANTKESKIRRKEPTFLRKIGSFLMMIPLGMQLLHLPMELASLKMSLLKSILIAKVALLVIFLRSLFLAKQHERVVIVRVPPPKQTHEHYYHPFGDPEDNKPGLFKPPAWME